MKYQNKLKLKFFGYTLLGILTNVIILIIAFLLEREVEVAITMICFFVFRPLYKNQYHEKSLFRCSIVSIIVFIIVASIEVEKSISILLSVVLAFVITLISSYVKEFIENKILLETYKNKLESIKTKCLENFTEDELIELMPNIRKDVIHIIYGYLHRKDKINAEIYAIQNNIGVATLYRYLKLVRESYEKLTTP